MAKKTSQPTTTSRQGKQRRKASRSWFHRHQLAVIIAVMAVVMMFGVAGFFGLEQHHGRDSWVRIPGGASSEQIHDSLRSALGNAEGNRVFMLWRLANGRPSAARGYYMVPVGELSLQTAMRLRGGRQTPIRVGWTDVRTFDQLAGRIASRMEFTKDDFLAVADTLLPSLGYTPEQFPAAFIPDSYEFYATDTPEQVVRRLVKYRDRYWTPARVNQARGLGLTPVEAATLASIVEEESGKADERPVIARLYLNRLAAGMPLQADPTVKFASGDFALRRIGAKQLAIDSPYNTYRRRGLPPGPIRIASKDGIEAVLAAPRHEFLYMCARADFSGYHDFAEDYATHQANARRYQAELDRRGIKE